MDFPDHVKIVEVGPRDGLQNEAVSVPTASQDRAGWRKQGCQWWKPPYLYRPRGCRK